MKLALADVCDFDCIASMRPLVLDLPSTERYVRGARAISQRVISEWAEKAGLLDLEGGSFGRAEIVTLRSQLEQLAEDVEFVSSASVTITLDDASGDMRIACALKFTTGQTYRFEVSTADAVALNFEAA